MAQTEAVFGLLLAPPGGRRRSCFFCRLGKAPVGHIECFWACRQPHQAVYQRRDVPSTDRIPLPNLDHCSVVRTPTKNTPNQSLGRGRFVILPLGLQLDRFDRSDEPILVFRQERADYREHRVTEAADVQGLRSRSPADLCTSSWVTLPHHACNSNDVVSVSTLGQRSVGAFGRGWRHVRPSITSRREVNCD